ncbi:MAG TPA: hypothetical protein VHL80_12720 [Polyangia bacterium]|nr:hypothetical protein [Polyangia bacterium]
MPAPEVDLAGGGAPSPRAGAADWDAFAKLVALGDPRRLGVLWLAELRRLTTEALRSPAFLALAKFNLGFLARRTRGEVSWRSQHSSQRM